MILAIIFSNLGNLLTAAGNDVISPLHYTEFGVLPLGDYSLKLLPHACLSLILAALVVWILEIRGDNIIQPRTHVYIRDVVSRKIPITSSNLCLGLHVGLIDPKI